MPTDSPTTQWIGLHDQTLFRYVSVVCISFLFAVALYLLVNPDLGLVLWCAVGAGVCGGCALVRRFRSRSLLLCLMLASMALGGLRVHLIHDPQQQLAPYVGKQTKVVGHVVDDPEVRARSVHLVVRTTSIEKEPIESRLLVIAPQGSSFSFGDEISVVGNIRVPAPFETETGKEFNYEKYLRAKGIGAVVIYPQIEVIAQASCCSVRGTLYAVKGALVGAIERVFPEPHGGLLKGMLLGIKDALPERLADDFRDSGLVHVVVLSGFNLTVVALAFMWLVERIPRVTKKARIIVGMVGILLFATMVGFSATVIRASAMAIIGFVAQLLRRPSVALRTLFVAGFCMVVWNPLVLVYDPAFILSFLATFGLTTLAPFFERKLLWIPTTLSLRMIAAATLATQVFITPALIFYTGQVSLASLPANLLALPLVSLAMLLGSIAGGLALISYWAAFPVMLAATTLLSVILWVAQTTAHIPGAVVLVLELQTPLIFVSYAALVPLALYLARREELHVKARA